MPIGGSDGSFFDDRFSFFKQVRPGEWAPSDDVDENIVKTPSEVMTGKKLDDAELDPTTGLGLEVSYKPSTAVPIDSSRLTDIHRGGPPVPMPEVIAKTKAGDITNEDVDSAINVGLSAGPGTIGGASAKAVDKTALYQARRMDMEGAHPDTIWDQTGWFKAADNRWKFEIKDANAQINPDKLELTSLSKTNKDLYPNAENLWYQVPQSAKNFFGQTTNPLYLKDFLDHPELYKQYPQLQDVKVIPTPGLMSLSGVKGFYTNGAKELALSPDTLSNMRSTALHEIQHGIQDIEGFSTGANTDVFKSDRWKNLEQGFSTFKSVVQDYTEKNIGKGLYQDFRDAIAKEPELLDLRMRAADGSNYAKGVLRHTEDMLQRAKDSGVYDNIKKTLIGDGIVKKYDAELYNAYKNVKGEVEARNVQNRLDPKIYKLNNDQAEPWFKDAGIALDTSHGPGGKNNTYGLRKWGTKEPVDPESLSPELKAVWDNLTTGRTKSQMRPTITEDVPRELQTWSPWDPQSLRDMYD